MGRQTPGITEALSIDAWWKQKIGILGPWPALTLPGQ